VCSYFQKVVCLKYAVPLFFSSVSKNAAKFTADGKRNFHISYTTAEAPGEILYQDWTELSG